MENAQGLAANRRRIYASATADEAEWVLGEFEGKWNAMPNCSSASLGAEIGSASHRSLITPPEIRKVIYTTNAIESVNMSLRKSTKNRGSFPSDGVLMKLFYLELRNISQK